MEPSAYQAGQGKLHHATSDRAARPVSGSPRVFPSFRMCS